MVLMIIKHSLRNAGIPKILNCYRDCCIWKECDLHTETKIEYLVNKMYVFGEKIGCTNAVPLARSFLHY